MNEIYGVVLDSSTKQPIPGITVSGMDANDSEFISDVTDENGNFDITSPLLNNEGAWVMFDDPAGQYVFNRDKSQIGNGSPVYMDKAVQKSSFVPIYILVFIIAIIAAVIYFSKGKKI